MGRGANITEFDRFGDWSEALCDIVLDVSASKTANDKPFQASISAAQLGAASMVRFNSGSHKIERDVPRIRRSQSDDFLVSFQRQGPTKVSCGDNRFILQPGDFAILDCSRPFTLTFPETVERQIARIPREVFCAGTGFDYLHNGFHLRGEMLSLRLLRHYFAEIDEEANNIRSSDLVYDIGRLLKDAVTGSDSPVSIKNGLWSRVQALIADLLVDPNLRLSTTATALSLSTRTIQREFSMRGTTFRAYVLNKRLEKAAFQLRDGRFIDHPITAIALRWGFNDTAHFSRVFRNRYRMSPTEFRSKLAR